MSKHLSEVRHFEVSGKRHDVYVSVRVEPNSSDWLLSDLSDDVKEQVRLFNLVGCGDLTVANILVEATALGLTGVSSQEHVIIMKHSDVDDVVANHAMIVNAIDDLKSQMQSQYNLLKEVFS